MKLTDVVAAGFVALMFLQVANTEIKNSGALGDDDTGEIDIYASADGVKSRSPNGMCDLDEPPKSISTSLLPSEDASLDDSDFYGISPEKLNEITFDVDAGWALGRDTKANTQRNPSYDLRSEPQNPRTLSLKNNPFLNTTMDFETRRPFELEEIQPTRPDLV